MNIQIPHKWLLEHLDTKATPSQISEYLSLCGPSIETIETIKGDQVYDIEVTTNRVDMMSVRGIAMEAAAILPEFDIIAKLKTTEGMLSDPSSLEDLDLTIKNDPKLCKRILAIKMSIDSVQPSPEWMTDRLEQVGQRPLNNIIDITNYVMWEIGHPIHVFDFDKLSKGNIVVRVAKKGETLVTLDDKTHTLKGGEVVFDDGTGTIVDLPGIMGTKNTVVSDSTKNFLVWIEDIPSTLIRKASMGLAIRSQAAILNEKHVDPNLGESAIKRAIYLYQDICNAKVSSQLVDIYPEPTVSKAIEVSQNQIDTYLGLHIDSKRIIRILENLGCQVNEQSEVFSVTPPSSRYRDITIYQDIIEEIARIYGYHNLPSTIMDTPIPDNPPEENFHLEYKIKTLLSGWGANEIYTYSMISESMALKSTYELVDHLKINNPLTDDMVYMRVSLIPSLVQVIEDNPGGDVTIFELQNVYHKQKPAQLPTEELQLVIATNKNYSHLRGLVDSLHKKLYISDFSVNPKLIEDEPLEKDTCGEILSGKNVLGVVGKVKGKNIYVAKYIFSSLLKASNTHPKYIPVTNTPPIVEDLTFTLEPRTLVGDLMDNISSASPLVESVNLKVIYQKNHTFTITYRDKLKPLSDKQIAPLRKKIVKILLEKHSAVLVGSLQ